MRELFFKIFAGSWFNTGIKITPFSMAHIAWMVLIFGGITLAWLCLRNKSDKSKTRCLRFVAYMLATLYISDFFFHEFVYDGLNTDKLPFHICTVLCPAIAVAQFNRKGGRIAEPVAILAILAPLMYLCYPASVGEGEPWCYQAVQTMLYHGSLLAWGILSVALGQVKPKMSNCWKAGVALIAITLWAKLGNILMEHNWFFLEEDAFYIGLVEGGIIPKWSLMIINPIVFFLAVLATYGVILGIQKATKKKVTV